MASAEFLLNRQPNHSTRLATFGNIIKSIYTYVISSPGFDIQRVETNDKSLNHRGVRHRQFEGGEVTTPRAVFIGEVVALRPI